MTDENTHASRVAEQLRLAEETDVAGDETMRRTPGVNYESDGHADVEDFVADYAHDAIDAGVHPKAVAAALQAAADELEEHARERDDPDRSEPADFGGGDSTGVQSL